MVSPNLLHDLLHVLFLFNQALVLLFPTLRHFRPFQKIQGENLMDRGIEMRRKEKGGEICLHPRRWMTSC